MHHTSFVPIPQNELGGAIVVNIFAMLSTLALLSVAIRAVWLLIRRHPFLTASEKREHTFLNTHFGRYGTCLLLAMTLSTASGIIGISWLSQRGITEGWLCRFQATLMQIACCGAAYFTVTIALHTFCSLVLRMRQSVVHCRSTMIIGWIFAITMGLIPYMIDKSHGHVYGAVGLTCGVRSVYSKTEFFLHLLPIFIASFLSVILYSLVFLALRGTLKFRGGIKLTLNPEVRWNNREENRLLARVARSMLLYPVAYIVLLVPYSFVRLLDISGFAVSFEAIVFAYMCWFSLGVVDVLLLYNTFRILAPVLLPPAKTEKNLSGRLQNFEYLTLRVSSTSQDEKIDYRDFLSSPHGRQGVTETSSKSFVLDSSLLNQDLSLTIPLSSPASDDFTISPPPSATLSSRSDNRRRDRENAPLLAAGIAARQSRFATAPPQSLGTYDGFVPIYKHEIIRQYSTQTDELQNPSRSRITSWSKWTSRNPYLMLSKANEEQAKLGV